MNPTKTLRERTSALARKGGLLLALAVASALLMHGLRIESAQAESLLAESRTELKQAQPAAATLALARARLIAPRSEHVRAALAAQHVQPPASALARTVSLLAPREWSLLLLTFGWVAGLGVALSLLRRQPSRLVKRLAIGAGVLFCVSAGGVAQSQLTARSLSVIKSPTGVLLAPYEGAGASADLEPGVVVEAGARYGQFLRILGPHGTSGWVTESALEAVVGS